MTHPHMNRHARLAVVACFGLAALIHGVNVDVPFIDYEAASAPSSNQRKRRKRWKAAGGRPRGHRRGRGNYR